MSTKEWREKNKERLRKYRRKYYYQNKESKERKRNFVDELKNKPCMDCGCRFSSYCMDFDHLDPTKKAAGVSQLLNNSWQKIKEEIKKCEVVCAICHRIREHKRRNGLVV